MAEDFTSKFKIDISDLQKNIRQAQDDIKMANATFKSETAGMDAWSKNADGLSSKLKSLESVLGSQKSILGAYEAELKKNQEAYAENGKRAEALKDKLQELSAAGVEKSSEEYQKYQKALKDVIKEQEKNGKAADDLKLKVLQQKAAVGETEGQIKKYQAAEQKMATESKSLSKTVETQAKDLKTLKDRYADVAAAEGKDSDAAKDLAKQIRDLSSDLDKNQKELDQSRAEADKLDASFEKAEKSSGNLASKLASGLKTGLAAIGTAAGAAVSSLTAMSVSTASYADDILTLSAKTGIATDDLEAYKYAAELVDVSMETMTGSMAKNVKSMASAAGGSASMQEAYAKLGVAVTNTDGSLRDSKDVYWALIDALGKIEDDTERDATAMQIFGKSAQELNPLIETGSEGMKALADEAREMGAVMGGEALKQAGEFDDSIQRLKGTASGVKNALGMVLMPALQSLADDGTQLLADFTRGLNDAGGDWDKISQVISRTVEAAAGVLMERLPKILEVGMNMATSIIKALSNSKLIKSIISTIVSAIPQVVQAAVQLFSGIVQAIPTIVTELVKALPQIAFAVIDGLKNMAKDVADAALEFFFGIVNESKKAQEELDKAGDAAGEYVAALKATEPDLVEYNKLFSETGKLSGEIDDEIREAEDAITEILRKAFEDQSGLRQQDIEDIIAYNEKIKELQAEKLGIYQGVQHAQVTVLESEGSLSKEQAAQYMADTKAAFEESNKIADEAYKQQLTGIEQYYASYGLVGSGAYQAAIRSAKNHHEEDLAENKKYYEESLTLIGQHVNDWVEKDKERWDKTGQFIGAFRKIGETELGEFILDLGDWTGALDDAHDIYRDMLTDMDLKSSAAFLSMVSTIKTNGGEVSKETEDMVKNMLGAFGGLPEDFEEVGTKTLLGLVSGMEGDIPELKDAANMSAEEIVNTIMDALDIHSPSRVTEEIGAYTVQGLTVGLTKGLPIIKQKSMEAAGTMTSTMLSKIGQDLNKFYTAGQKIVDSIKQGILSRESSLQSELSAMLGRISANLSISAGVTGGKTPGGTTNNSTVNNFTQVINAPEAPSRLELYRQTENILRVANS